MALTNAERQRLYRIRRRTAFIEAAAHPLAHDWKQVRRDWVKITEEGMKLKLHSPGEGLWHWAVFDAVNDQKPMRRSKVPGSGGLAWAKGAATGAARAYLNHKGRCPCCGQVLPAGMRGTPRMRKPRPGSRERRVSTKSDEIISAWERERLLEGEIVVT